MYEEELVRTERNAYEYHMTFKLNETCENMNIFLQVYETLPVEKDAFAVIHPMNETVDPYNLKRPNHEALNIEYLKMQKRRPPKGYCFHLSIFFETVV